MRYRIKKGEFKGREALALININATPGTLTVRVLKDRESGRKEERVNIPVKHLEAI